MPFHQQADQQRAENILTGDISDGIMRLLMTIMQRCQLILSHPLQLCRVLHLSYQYMVAAIR